MKRKTPKKTKTVLILENDPDTRDATALILTKTNEFIALTSGSCSDALFKIKNQKFDCIVLDYHLGVNETSESLIHYVRVLSEFNKETPIVLMTSGILKEAFLKIKSKINTILIKPVPGEDLVNRVKTFTSSETINKTVLTTS